MMRKINKSILYILLCCLCIGCNEQYPYPEELAKAKEVCVNTLNSNKDNLSNQEEDLYNYLNNTDEEGKVLVQGLLRRAIRADNAECVEYALETGADVNETIGFLNEPVLIYAIKNSEDPYIIRILISEGVLINAKTSILRQTALIVASNHCDEDVVQILIEADADVHAENILGQTALTLARNSLTDANRFSLQENSDLAQKCEKVISTLTTAEANQPQNNPN